MLKLFDKLPKNLCRNVKYIYFIIIFGGKHMNKARIYEIMKNKEIYDVFYNERPIWIQSIQDDIAKIGFMDSTEIKDVYIEDLYEKNLYNKNN